MVRFIGEIYWYEGYYKDIISSTYESVKVERAILENNVFKISYFTSDNSINALLSLKSKDGFSFDGSIKGIDDDKFSGKMNFEYYNNNDKSILIGKWVDEGEVNTCIIELKEVKKFKD